MGKILSIIGNFLSIAQKHNLGKKLSIIDWGLLTDLVPTTS